MPEVIIEDEEAVVEGMSEGCYIHWQAAMLLVVELLKMQEAGIYPVGVNSCLHTYVSYIQQVEGLCVHIVVNEYVFFLGSLDEVFHKQAGREDLPIAENAYYWRLVGLNEEIKFLLMVGQSGLYLLNGSILNVALLLYF